MIFEGVNKVWEPSIQQKIQRMSELLVELGG